tara:strand:+ start:221 stop:469 length:249 start_codon:yes stop_codon:yes gene_type:complete
MFETDFTNKKNIERRLCPHHAVITMKIDIRKIDTDGNFDSQVIGNSILEKYGITNKAQICFSATSEAECIKLVKEKMERLNG